MSLSQTYFENAHHIKLNNVQFTNVIARDFVSTAIREEVASGAIFDSAERYPAGKCHPGTRSKIIERISNWILNDPYSDSLEQRILWIHGPVGSDKSALTHSICEFLREFYPERYGASFFFARGPTDRGKASKLFTTISYQLALQFPFLRAEINEALYRDPSLPTKSMEIQLLSLIVRPLLSCRNLWPQIFTIIIDGLDECDATDTQRYIVALIAKSIVENGLPFRFIIASRPEYWIRDAFDTALLLNITLAFLLQNNVDTHKDIRSYLIDGFEKIRMENKRVMRSVEPPWPPIGVIDHFVHKASGQFTYASIILNFVGKHSGFIIPQEQLRIIFSPGSHQNPTFSELDELYISILSSYPRWETMKRVLGGILVDANTTVILVALGVDPNELVLVLDALSSLVDIKKPNMKPVSDRTNHFEWIFGFLLGGQDTISFYHPSFREFLEDQTRSGVFYIDVHQVWHTMVRAFFGVIYRNPTQDFEIGPRCILNIGHGTYQSIIFNLTFQTIWDCRIGTLLPLVSDMTARLVPLDPERLIHTNSLLCFTQGIRLFESALGAVLDHKLKFEREEVGEEPRKIDEFQKACQKLQNALCVARRRAMCSLVLCSEFKVASKHASLTHYLTRFMWADARRGITYYTQKFDQEKTLTDQVYTSPFPKPLEPAMSLFCNDEDR